MWRLGLSMRWWLTLAFALIAAITALAVAEVFSQRSERAFRERAEDLAVGSAVGAANAVGPALRRGRLDQAIGEIADNRRLALFVFADDGSLITPERSHKLTVARVPDKAAAVESALSGNRYVSTSKEGGYTVVALPLHAGEPGSNGTGIPAGGTAALLVYASRPELAAELGIVRDKIIEAALWAVLIGALVGLPIAVLITARLRRIAGAATAIEGGRFDTAITPRFRDELGSLAATIDRMRERLRDSFSRLESERARLETLLERLEEGVIMVDSDLKVEFANRSALRFLGDRTLRVGEPLPDPFGPPSLRRLATGLFAPSAPSAQARVSPESDRAYLVVGLPAQGGYGSAVMVITDVTERERRERAEREFVTNAAHELRTPLAAITSSVEVLQAGAKEVPEERDRFISHIERESLRLGRLARALLTLARVQTREEPLRVDRVDVASLLREVADSIRPAEGVEVLVDCEARTFALANSDLLEQALANLASNAAKHTGEGRILLAARSLSPSSVAIEVSDTGSGILASDQDRVFDRFYRAGDRDAEGFGLGLSIVKQSVRALGGAVNIESAAGRGTTIRIVLPSPSEQAA